MPSVSLLAHAAARIRERRALPGGTTTLGFALLTLRRAAQPAAGA